MPEERTEEAEVNSGITPALRVSDIEWEEELVTDLQ
jgi:hypothetical protein